MTQPRQGVSGTLRRLGASVLALGRIRLELLAIEVHEEKERLAALLFWSVLSALLIGFFMVFLAAFVTVALWDSNRLLALGLCAGLFFSLGAFGTWRVRQLTSAGPTLFQTSLAELRNDEAAVRTPSGAA